jgi:hypothetical protein
MGATLTVDRYEMALSRVNTTTGRFFVRRSKAVEADISPSYSAGHAASASQEELMRK